MIIQCEQCRTKFRLDDSKVSERGVKVRCAKCRHIFTVRKDTETSTGTVLSAPEATPSAVTFTPTDAFEQPQTAPVFTEPAAPEATDRQPDFEATEAGFSFGEATPAEEQPDTEAIRFDFGEASAAPLPGEVEEFKVTWTEPEAGFSFSEAPSSETSASDAPDFSGLDLGEEQPLTADTAAASELSEPEQTITELSPPVITEEQPEQPTEPPTIAEATAAEEAPPLPISSRRRQSSIASILIAVITILVVSVLGYMAYLFISGGPQALSLFSKQGAPVEEGKITVQNVTSYFVPAAASGELLVITGTAQNSYTKPRAALQLKATLFGQNNQVLATKTAYAGNQLTREQLAAMPAEKIEAAMNNQFGDSLINLEVPPGKGIPFTLVLINPPKDARDYGVEAAGSTVATANK